MSHLLPILEILSRVGGGRELAKCYYKYEKYVPILKHQKMQSQTIIWTCWDRSFLIYVWKVCLSLLLDFGNLAIGMHVLVFCWFCFCLELFTVTLVDGRDLKRKGKRLGLRIC